MTDATREKVQKVVDRLGYRINVSARNLNRGRTGFITLAVPCLTALILRGSPTAIDAARIYGYSVYVTTYAEARRAAPPRSCATSTPPFPTA